MSSTLTEDEILQKVVAETGGHFSYDRFKQAFYTAIVDRKITRMESDRFMFAPGFGPHDLKVQVQGRAKR